MTSASGLYSKGGRPVTTCKVKVRFHDRKTRSGQLVRASRIVIPSAYMSALFDGNFL